MAYSYVDGPYSAEWLPSGGKAKRKIGARLYYQVTESTTQYTISVYGQETVWKDNVGVTVKGKLNLTGCAQVTGSRTTVGRTENTNHTGVYYTICSTTSRTWNKTTSAQSASASMKAYKSDQESSIYSIASKSFSIPALPRYNVVFNSNGHGSSPATQSIFHGYKASQPAAPTAAGYTFGGWFTEAACKNAWNFNTAIYAARTLYAKWTPNRFTVTYNANGGEGTMPISTFTYDENSNLALNTFTKKDYLFEQWATSADTSTAGIRYFSDGASVKNLLTSGNQNLYALWQYQYMQADLIESVAWRRQEQSGGNIENDDAGTLGAAAVIVKTPAIRKIDLRGNSEYINTEVKLFYKASNEADSQYKMHPTILYTDQPDTILTWYFDKTHIPDVTQSDFFDLEKQYDILFVARGLVEEEGVQVEKSMQQASTFISTAEFALDINADGSSFGLFSTAPGTYAETEESLSRVKTVSINGDLLLSIDENIGEGHIDNDIVKAIRGLAWDVYVNPQDVI